MIHVKLIFEYDVSQQGSSLLSQMVKNMPAMQETQVWSLGQEIPLEKGLAIHSSGYRPVMLSIFSCVYLSSIYHLWWRLQAKIFPFLKMGHLHFYNWMRGGFKNTSYKSFVRYTLYKYLLTVYGLPFILKKFSVLVTFHYWTFTLIVRSSWTKI